MLKNILKLEGAQKLSKNEQKSINGAIKLCGSPRPCCGTLPAGTLVPVYKAGCPPILCDSSC